MTGCGKVRYETRDEARRARKQIGDAGLRPYRCWECEGKYHLGHLPSVIREGKKTRGEVYGGGDEAA